MPFAALAELIISVRCFGYDLDEAAMNLRALDSNSPDSDFFSERSRSSRRPAATDSSTDCRLQIAD